MAFSGFMERTKLRLMVDSATGNSDDPTPSEGLQSFRNCRPISAGSQPGSFAAENGHEALEACSRHM